MPRGGEGMADAFQVWLGVSTHTLAHAPLVMLAGRHDETVSSSSLQSFVLTLAGVGAMMMIVKTRMKEVQHSRACQRDADLVSLEARLDSSRGD